MSKMIQIRNVPDELHRKLKARAAGVGLSLSDYLLRELKELADLPSLEEWLDIVRTREPVLGGESSVELIRSWRDRE